MKKKLWPLIIIAVLLTCALGLSACKEQPSAVTYTITFDSYGGSAVAPVTVEKGGSVDLPTPAKKGFNFDGWFDNAELSGGKLSTPYTPSGNVTLYAKWTEDGGNNPTPTENYTIEFDSNGGNYIEPITVEKGGSVDLPAPAKEGFAFNGWFDNAALTGVKLSSPYIVSGNATLYAKWTEGSGNNPTPTQNYTIEFDSNGGNYIEPIVIQKGSTILLPAPTKEGFAFDGWFDNAALTGVKIADSYTPDGNVTLYAKWTETPTEHSHRLTHIPAENATCMHTGNIEYWICYDCHTYFYDENGEFEITDTISLVIPIADHIFSPAWTGDDMYHWHKCENCDWKSGFAFHSWNNGEITKQATCTENGIKTYSCTVCGRTKTQTIPAMGHSFTAAWSNDETNHWHKCENCDEISGLVSHTWNNGEITKQATCTENGIKTYSCTICAGTKTEIIPAMGHSFTAAWSNDETNHWHKCENCDEISGLASHSWNNGEITTPATCTADGIKTYSCTICAGTKTEIIPATGHSYSKWTVTMAPTCVDTGLKERTCVTCVDKEIKIIPATGHSFNEWTVTMAPTCVDTGLKERTCVTCVDKEIKIIPATGHSFNEWNSDEINHWHKCSECGEIIDVALHSWLEVTCTECGFILGTKGLKYTKNVNAYTVTGIGTATDKNIVIPSKYNGLPVTSIGQSAFKGCSGLTSITISDNVTNVGRSAFEGCSSLTSIIIPDGVTNMGSSALKGCSALNSVTIGNSVTSIGYDAFRDCSGLTSIIIPNSVTSIGDWAFKGCSALNSVTIGNSVTSIGYDAFRDCSGLTSIIIPDSVTSIGDSAFAGCSGLTSITIPDSVTSIGDSAFAGCSGLTSITIPSGVTSIGDGAFQGCRALTVYTEISVKPSGWNNTWNNYANNWNRIDCPVVWNCKNNEVASDGNIYFIAENGVRYALKDSTATVAIQSEKIGDFIEIPITITYKNTIYDVITIVDYAFRDCGGLTGVTIANGVTGIGISTFEGCAALTDVTIGNGVTSIGDSAFEGCGALTKVFWNAIDCVKAGFSNYNDYTIFSGCSALKEVTFGNNVKRIPAGAFKGCSGLTSIIIPDSVILINVAAFENCSSLTGVIIGNSVNAISQNVFSGCIALTDITVAKENKTYHSEGNCIIETATKTLIIGCKTSVIPTDGSVTTIGQEAFSKCSTLTEITIPDNVTDIEAVAFKGCYGLTSITIPDSVISIWSNAFSECYALIIFTELKTKPINWQKGWSYTCPVIWDYKNNEIASDENIYYIAENGLRYALKDGTATAERQSKKLSGSIEIPATIMYKETSYSVTSVGDYAFYGCNGLTSIKIPNSVTSIGQYAFFKCSALRSIGIPDSVTSIGNNALNETDWYNNKPDGLVYAGKVAYKYKGHMTSDTNVTLKNDTVVIADYAFYQCYDLTDITIPNSVTTIGADAFYRCGLTSITIPDSVTSIGASAFSYCSELMSITVVSGNRYYRSAGNCLIEAATNKLILGCKNSVIPTDGSVTSIDNGAFYGCSGLTSITIPNSVTSIGTYAFYGCSKLTSITIPNSVMSIGDYAFFGCSGLTSITIPNSVASIGNSAFFGTTWYNNQPDGLVYAGKVAYKYKGTMPSNTNIILKSDTVGVAENAFYNCNTLVSIEIPASVTHIGDYAFYGCYKLTGIEIPAELIYIGDYAFYECVSITDIRLPYNMTKIGNYSFYNCYKLTNIAISANVTYIGSNAFYNCSELTNILYNGTKAQWKAINKDSDWNTNTANYTVTCTDGTLTKSES